MITSLTRAATSHLPQTFVPSSAKSSPNTSALPTSSPFSPPSTTARANSQASSRLSLVEKQIPPPQAAEDRVLRVGMTIVVGRRGRPQAGLPQLRQQSVQIPRTDQDLIL